MEQLFGAISPALGELESNLKIKEAIVFAAWVKCAGEPLKTRTAPLQLAGDRLIIAVLDETWRRHLENLSPQMLARINGHVGQRTVKFIEFQINESAVKTANVTAEHVEQEVADVNKSLADAANSIGDDGLRKQFLDAAASCLSRKKSVEYGQIG